MNEDSTLSEDEVSAQTWTRLAGVDSDADNAVTVEEIAAARFEAARGPITLAFSTDGGPPNLAREEITAAVGTSLAIEIYLIQLGDDTRIRDSGVISFGVDVNHETELVEVTDAEVSSEFGAFPLADTSTPGLVKLSGVSSLLATPVNSGGEGFLLLGSLTVQLTAAGTTTFTFVDPNPNPTIADNALGDATSTDLDQIVFRDGDAPRTITLRVNSVDQTV